MTLQQCNYRLNLLYQPPSKNIFLHFLQKPEKRRKIVTKEVPFEICDDAGDNVIKLSTLQHRHTVVIS
jgi:hypothetical protein